ADSERQREEDSKRVRGRRPEDADCIAEMGPDGVEERDAMDIAQFFLDSFGATEIQSGLTPSAGGWNALADLFLGELFDVKLDFVIELGGRGFAKQTLP